MNYNPITINIVAGKYPMAEVCVLSFRSFCPHTPIIVSLNEAEIYRKGFFDKFDVNLKVVNKSNFVLQMDNMVKECNTEFFASCGDEILFIKGGIIEKALNLINSGYYSFVGKFCPYTETPTFIMPRLDISFLVGRTDEFILNDMTFLDKKIDVNCHNHDTDIKSIFFDKGAFIFMDILKYRLKFVLYEFNEFITRQSDENFPIDKISNFIKLNHNMFERDKIDEFYGKIFKNNREKK